ncbi:MAG: hypothetical protein KDN19_00715 [Verrucomicrobiae bacterium]|nr:hypothetical protein [Verrucomicrobiae bacterium]
METPPSPESADRNHGPQPLDAILTELGIDNHELVAASTEQLTHKQVQKGRKGRQLTANLQRKIANALNALSQDRQFRVDELFSYRG